MRLILQLSGFLGLLVAVFAAGALAMAVVLPHAAEPGAFLVAPTPYDSEMGKTAFGDQSPSSNIFNRCDGAFTYVVPETGRPRPLVYCYMFSFSGYSRE
ncbi:hypothetical protein N8D56_18975 [Devosia sp. A8/3-2]|nr:hypothetical protein N8D56_18975 [Devosia sp. A8/3-2]